MSNSFNLSIDISRPYDFTKKALDDIEIVPWVKNQWPIVYFLENERDKIGYIGESTNALARIVSHLGNPDKANKFTKISIIGCDKFNKSATLDIESNLIQYITAEGTYKLTNGNYGLVDHAYYQRDLYKGLFREIWSKLQDKKLVSKSLQEIENSQLFKYSPYKSLNEDQYKSVLEILKSLTKNANNRIFIGGSAGTGKTVLATYLMKLLYSNVNSEKYEELSDDELLEVKYIKRFQQQHPNASIGLVIAMTSLRESIKNVFRKIPGLSASMVINPSETFNLGKKYDLLIVDEAHRLRQYRNIGWRGVFKQNNQKLNLNNDGNELDWIVANSNNQIFFYDPSQSVKPSDIEAIYFERLLAKKATQKLQLKSQMRVEGGPDYISFIDELLNPQRGITKKYVPKNYEIRVFDSLKDLYATLSEREKKYRLCRLVAGYSWPWLSANKNNKAAIDIEIEGLKFQWNQTKKDWINSPNAFREVGCIHTTQGYDLNYTGVIFGREINYDPKENQLVIDPKLYFDPNGKIGVYDLNVLKAYIINIYKTIMYRGIKGAFVYAYHKELREYLKKYINNEA